MIEKNITFIFQLNDVSVRIVKCRKLNDAKREFMALHTELVSPGPDGDDSVLGSKIAQAFKKLGFTNQPIIISLPRSQATCRYSRVPSQDAGEIEKITNLYASRYLPYPQEELVTGYEILSREKDGYSCINQTVAHKGIVERCVNILKNLNSQKVNVILSSYGLVNLYNYLKPEDGLPVVLIDSDSFRTELAVVQNKKLLFSRSFKSAALRRDFAEGEPDGASAILSEEINKSIDAYLKETASPRPVKVILLGTAGIINSNLTLPVEVLDFSEKIAFSADAVKEKNLSEFSCLIGLGLEDADRTLSLLTTEFKNKISEVKKSGRIKRNVLFLTGIFLITLVAFFKDLDNKKTYLVNLKTELSKISKETKDLEGMDRKLKFLDDRAKSKLNIADMFYELNSVLPLDVSLTGLVYEEEVRVVIRGQAQSLDSVFVFVSQLEKQDIFKVFNPKVRFATKKKTREGEIVEFEIVCMKK